MLLPFERISLPQQLFGGLTSFQRRFRMEDAKNQGPDHSVPKKLVINSAASLFGMTIVRTSVPNSHPPYTDR